MRDLAFRTELEREGDGDRKRCVGVVTGAAAGAANAIRSTTIAANNPRRRRHVLIEFYFAAVSQ